MQSNYIYIISFLFGSLFDVTSIRNVASSRLPSSLTTTSSKIVITLKDRMNYIRELPNSLHANNCIRVLPTRALISPILVAMLFPLSSALAETVENGNIIVSSSSMSSSVTTAAFLLTSGELDIVLTIIGGFFFFSCAIPFAIAAFYHQLVPFFIKYGFRGLETSVVKLQIGLDAETWSESDSKDMPENLSDLSSWTMGKRLSEAAVKLLHRQADWNSATLDSRVFRSFSAAELEYHRLSLSEQSKIQGEGEGHGTNLLRSQQQWLDKLRKWYNNSLPSQPVVMSKSIGSEVVVVTLLALIRGRSGTYRGLTGILPVDRRLLSLFMVGGGQTTTAAEVRQSLLALASEALLDDGLNMERAEVLCGPLALSSEEALLVYPELRRL